MQDNYNKPGTLITLGLPSADVDFLAMLQKFIEREAERRQRIVPDWLSIRIDGVHHCVIDSQSWCRLEFEGSTCKVEIVGRDAEGEVVIATYLPTYDGPKTEAWKVLLPWGDEVSCTFEYDDEDCVRVEAKRIVKPKLGEKHAQLTREPEPGFWAFDKAYVERLRNGDPATEHHFFYYFGRLLQIKLRSRAISSDKIEDLKQETFIRVIAAVRREGVVQPERFGTFVISVCNRVLLEHYRSLGKNQRIDEMRKEIPDKVLEPEEMMVSKQFSERVRRILSGTPARDRDYCDQVTEELSLLAASPQMVRIRQQIVQIGPVDVPVFICGESGVGKEVVARMIHLRSKRRNQPFVKVNCAALPAELLESELFGFEQGAFTGAVRSKPGKFELANRGTIFLDEIAEMSTHLQAKLLHVLQDHQYSRLGGRHMVETDVRVLAAANVEVHDAMKSGRFREDLYHRLNVLSINVPPLRERSTEIPLLFQHFLQKYSEKYGKPGQPPSKHLLDAAVNYPWPGNLRELENFVKRYVILEDDEGSLRELVEMSSTRHRTSPREEPALPKDQGLKALVRGLKNEAEMEAIADALEKTRWCRKDAAKMLGISYKALLYKMRQFNLDTCLPEKPRSL